MNALRTSLLCAALSLCAAPAFADFAIQYFVGYGLYYPFAPDTTSTVSRTTGLLATNGTHRALIQLIWAGPNGQRRRMGLHGFPAPTLHHHERPSHPRLRPRAHGRFAPVRRPLVV